MCEREKVRVRVRESVNDLHIVFFNLFSFVLNWNGIPVFSGFATLHNQVLLNNTNTQIQREREKKREIERYTRERHPTHART